MNKEKFLADAKAYQENPKSFFEKQNQEYIDSLPKKVGDKVIFKGTHPFWFTNMIKDAEENLIIGGEYTIKTITAASSWTGLVLEEFPEMKFSFSWFE